MLTVYSPTGSSTESGSLDVPVATTSPCESVTVYSIQTLQLSLPCKPKLVIPSSMISGPSVMVSPRMA